MGAVWLVREEGPQWGNRKELRKRLERELAEAAAHVDAALHRLLVLVLRCDEAGIWRDEGFPTCGHWLACRIGVGVGSAREYVRVAHALPRLRRIDEALRKGQVSYSQVRAITRVADEENEEALLESARVLPAAKLERLVHGIATSRAAAAATPSPGAVLRERYARFQAQGDGMTRVEMLLPDDEAATLRLALDDMRVQYIEREARRRRKRAVDEPDTGAAPLPGGGEVEGGAGGAEPAAAPGPDAGPDRAAPAATGGFAPAPGTPPHEHPAVARGRAEALVLLAEHWLGGGSGKVGAAKPLDLILFADRESLAGSGTAWFADGTGVSAETARRRTCSANIVDVRAGAEGNLLDIGRRSRVPTEKLESALYLRDRCCRFPGCANEAFLNAHHIIHWAQGGPTDLGNLLLLCRRHHTLVHEGGFGCAVVEGRLQFRMPGGEVLSEEPLARPGEADASFRAWLEKEHPGPLERRPLEGTADELAHAEAIAALLRASGLEFADEEEGNEEDDEGGK